MNTKRIETKERYYEIVNGPNRDTLFDACKYAYSRTVKFAIDFSIADGYTMSQNNPARLYIPIDMHDVIVQGIEHEDGSGESFNIYGLCKAVLHKGDGTKEYQFNTYYNTKRRTGTIRFFEQHLN